MKKFLFVCAVMALFPACATSQRLIVMSDPDGAEISIIKRGQLQAQGTVPGVITVGQSTPFEDEPVVIGRTPMVYEFEPVQRHGGFEVPGIVETKENKVCQQVVVRAKTKDGQVAEQIIQVNSGSEAHIYLKLAPSPMTPPPGQPAPVHAASPVQPQS